MYGGSGGGYVTMTSSNDSHTGGGAIETLTATFTTTGSVSSEFAAFVGIDNARSASDTTIVTGDYFEVYDFQLELGQSSHSLRASFIRRRTGVVSALLLPDRHNSIFKSWSFQ